MQCDAGCSVSRAGIWPYAPLMAVLLVPVLAAGERAVREVAMPRDRAVAITFDDVPGVATLAGTCDPDGIRSVNRRLLGALERNHVPAAALVVGSRVCDAHRDTLLPAVLAEWRDAGHGIGNHSFSHRDLNTTPLEEYVADIARNQALLDDVVDGPLWFRAPMLHAGDTEAKKEGLRRWLDDRGYGIAPVTIDNQEWIYADVYARAKAAGDTALARRAAVEYVPFMDSVLAFFERRSRAVLGREPPQVLLLHANELNADHLDALLEMMRRRGYRFVPLSEAVADPAYDRPDGYTGPRGLSWIHRWGLAEGVPVEEEPREPAWLNEARGSLPPLEGEG
jgi:peptidoglycan/xylan/chitin deacetylase (PgdA/CDA1 family)